MSKLVLPPDLPKNVSAERPDKSRSAGSGSEKSGQSAFDEVSRSEQKRLEAERAEKKQASRQSVKADTADSGAEKPKKPEQATAREGTHQAARDSRTDGEKKTDKRPLDQGGENLPVNHPGPEGDINDQQALLVMGETATELALQGEQIDVAYVSFAGLQNLTPLQQANALSPVDGNSQVTVTSQGVPAMFAAAGLNTGAKASGVAVQSQGESGSTPGAVLAETLLAGVGAEGSTKVSDGALLQNAVRFQGALELVNGQASSLNTPKMAPETQSLRAYATSIDVPVSHAEWGDKVAGKLTWLTARNMSVAEIHLTPPDMGPMEVRVQVHQDQANVSVHSANPVVRDQLELHGHRLREMLNEQGFSLEKFDVSDSSQNPAGGGGADSNGQSGDYGHADTGAEANTGSEPQALDIAWKGQVDLFA